jgi:hypothetical protein
MPRGDKSSYTDKQKREAEHIEKSYEKKGVSKKTAESRAWATVNKQDGGGKKQAAKKAPKKAAPKKSPGAKKKSASTSKSPGAKKRSSRT